MSKNEQANTPAVPGGMVKEIFQDMNPEERIDALRQSADQVVNHSYTKPYTDEEISEKQKKISQLCIEISNYERELASIKAQYKSLITPLENDREDLFPKFVLAENTSRRSATSMFTMRLVRQVFTRGTVFF